MHLETGMLVQHASLGLGKVVALEPTAVHVVFAAQDAGVATKLRLPVALSFLGPAEGSDPRLSGLPGFELDAKTGRYAVHATSARPKARARAKAAAKKEREAEVDDRELPGDPEP